jgi:outer membrane protein assembly factor BamA
LRGVACAFALAAAARPGPGLAENDAPPKIVVKEIRTHGNFKTSRGVILHYCEFEPGDVMTQKELDVKIRRTRRNLENTQFFSRLNVFDLPRSNPDEAVIMIDMAEGTDWHFSASTWQAELSKENIGGDAVTAGVEFGLERQRLFYEQPWIFDSRFFVAAAGFFENGHRTPLENDDGYGGEWFYHEAAGGEGELAYLITLRTKAGIGVLGEYANYYDVRIKADPEGRYGIKDEATLIAARPYVEWDARDNDRYPTKGGFFLVKSELSSPEAGDYDYALVEGDVRGYVSPWGKFVIAERVRGGVATEYTPYIRRISIRGADGLRNVASTRTIGTRALLFTTEFRRRLFKSPIFDAWFEGVVFCDAGRAWDPGQPVRMEGFDYAFGPGIRIHMRSPFFFDWRAELNVNEELSFYATARRAF